MARKNSASYLHDPIFQRLDEDAYPQPRFHWRSWKSGLTAAKNRVQLLQAEDRPLRKHRVFCTQLGHCPSFILATGERIIEVRNVPPTSAADNSCRWLAASRRKSCGLWRNCRKTSRRRSTKSRPYDRELLVVSLGLRDRDAGALWLSHLS
ncbi:hypothetical protein KM043_006930 [Ampulex compressa]|nr:hypothetical protein KM043_006930 [Ampulex compressa]